MVGEVLEYEISHIRKTVVILNDGINDVSQGESYIDAAIALLEIGLLLLERTKRLTKPNHSRIACSCICCGYEPGEQDGYCCWNEWECNVTAHFMSLSGCFRLVRPFIIEFGRYSEIHESQSDEEVMKLEEIPLEKDSKENLISDWVIAVGYATSDGSPHAIRSVLLKYVDLPTMLPHLGPNDLPEDVKPRWLFDAVRAVDEILRYKRMPERRIEAVPDIAGMSI